jgi:hypothetical protein
LAGSCFLKRAGVSKGGEARVLFFVHEAGCGTYRVTEVTPSQHDGPCACVTDADPTLVCVG